MFVTFLWNSQMSFSPFDNFFKQKESLDTTNNERHETTESESEKRWTERQDGQDRQTEESRKLIKTSKMSRQPTSARQRWGLCRTSQDIGSAGKEDRLEETKGVRVKAVAKGQQVADDGQGIQREIEMSCDGLSVRHVSISHTPLEGWGGQVAQTESDQGLLARLGEVFHRKRNECFQFDSPRGKIENLRTQWKTVLIELILKHLREYLKQRLVINSRFSRK